MPAGVTTFSSKVNCTQSDALYVQKVYSPLELASVLTQSTSVGLTTMFTQVGNKIPIATGDGSSTSNIAGLTAASGDVLDFLCHMPANTDTTKASYLDVYYFLTGAATKGDKVSWNGSYRLNSVNSTTYNMVIATNTSGVTNPSERTIATGKTFHFMYKDTITFGASTFTADTFPTMRVKALGTYQQPELRIARIVHRYARAYM